MTRKRTASEILRDRVGETPQRRHRIAQAKIAAGIAEEVYRARTEAGLTQERLAHLVGTTQPAIARLEDADYVGHSMKSLARIAAALGLDLHIRLAPRTAPDHQPAFRRRKAG